MEDGTIAGLINPDQFKTVKHKIVFYNLTTETELLVPRLIRLISFGPGVLSFQIPSKTCAQGHILEIYFIPEDDTNKTYNKSILAQIHDVAIMKGKVIEFAPNEKNDKFIDVVVGLESYDEKSFKSVIEKYEKRQGILDSILQRCKG